MDLGNEDKIFFKRYFEILTLFIKFKITANTLLIKREYSFFHHFVIKEDNMYIPYYYQIFLPHSLEYYIFFI